MVIVDADFHFELRLSPETGAIGTRQSYSGIEICELELAVFAVQFDAGFVVGIFAEVILGQKFEADVLGSASFCRRTGTASICRRR